MTDVHVIVVQGQASALYNNHRVMMLVVYRMSGTTNTNRRHTNTSAATQIIGASVGALQTSLWGF